MKIRPRFQIPTELSRQELEKRVHLHLTLPEAPCRGIVTPGFITLMMPPARRKYWSPQLVLSLEEGPEGLVVRGLFGPRPEVWTLFVFFYSLVGFALLMVALYGFSQLSLGRQADILFLLPILALVLTSLYAVSYTGQQASRHETEVLSRFFERATGLRIPQEETRP
jgi:hypothetical protein